MWNVSRLRAARRALVSGAFACSTFSVVAWDATVARACSIAGSVLPPALVGYPQDGAVGVPTDVLPIYGRSAAYGALNEPYELDYSAELEDRTSSFELVDAMGVVTPLEIGDGGGAWFVELVPAAPLAPQTRYTVRTISERSSDGGVELSFTTGNGPHAAPVVPPLAAIEHYTLLQDYSSLCGPVQTGSCISFAAPAPGEYIEERGFLSGSLIRSPDALLFRAPRFTDIAGVGQGTPYDCIALRTRAPNGAFSDPLTLCREDGELFDLGTSQVVNCTEGGIRANGMAAREAIDSDTPEPLVADSAGCNVASNRRTGPLSALVCAIALLGLPLRRRHGRQVHDPISS